MSRINTLDKLHQKIDKELAWRRQDLTGIKFDVEEQQASQNTKIKERFIKYGVVLLYSHWEGAVKNIAEYYLNFVSCQRLKYKDLKNNFLTLGVKANIDQSGHTKKLTVRNQLITEVLNKLDEVSNIPTDIISADSNLNSEILGEIFATIGISEDPFSIYYTLIDAKLLQNRNLIAHGEHFGRLDGIRTIDEYLEVHEKIATAIDEFATVIKDAAQNEEFKR